MIKDYKLPNINNIDKKLFHELTINILNKVDFGNVSSVTRLADKYSDAYIKVYNFLVKKYYKGFSEDESKAHGNILDKLKI